MSKKFKIWIDRSPEEYDIIPFLQSVVEHITGSRTQLTSSKKSADLKFITERTLRSWFVSLGPTFANVGRVPASLLSESQFEFLLNLHGYRTRTIFVTGENLQHPGLSGIGDLIRRTTLPRLTSWPNELDPVGQRFPYWFSHIDWPELRGAEQREYRRFGELLDLDVLSRPLDPQGSRTDAVALMVGHTKFPRDQILANVSERYHIAIPSESERKGTKKEFLQRHTYAFAGENSLGFGYCTEKVPEAWQAGCFPVGVFPTPFSDWNDSVVGLYAHSAEALEKPLLKEVPTLEPLTSYIAKHL